MAHVIFISLRWNGGTIMAKKRFGLLTSVPAKDEKELMLKEYHQHWRKTNSDSNASFVPLFYTFRDKHLAELDPGPLRLYLFFAFASHNQYGHSWHSIESIASFFDTQTRTIDNWIKTLVNKKLIYREKKGKKSHTTYLIPYSNTILRHQLKRNIKEDTQKILDMFLNKIKEREILYGPAIEVFHFFQWKVNKKNKPATDGSIQWLVILTKRDDEVLTTHFYSLKNSKHLGVSELEIDDIATFKSPFNFNGHSIRGIALTHNIRLVEANTGVVLKLVEDIDNQMIDWEEYPTVTYGEITEYFSEEGDEENEEIEG